MAGSAGTAGSGGLNALTPAIVRQLPEQVRGIVIGAYNDALTPIFVYMVPLLVLAGILLFFIKEIPLATSINREPENPGAEHDELNTTGA